MENVPNDFFTPLGNNRPFLKFALQGEPKSGKTYTAVQIAIGLHKEIKSTKPIVCYDTERALKSLIPVFERNNIQVMTKESRTLADLNKTMDYCKNGYSDILIIDSVTHVWENFLQAYGESKTYNKETMDVRDWGIIGKRWRRDFSDPFVLGNLHIIFTGREGDRFENTENEQTHKKEMSVVGKKMIAQKQTAYEPDLLIFMEKIETLSGKNKGIKRIALVQDRTATIDGKIFENPTYSNFKPAIDILLNGKWKENTSPETKDKFEDKDYTEQNKKNERDIAVEEIGGDLKLLFPTQQGFDKKMKAHIINTLFKTTSWTAIKEALDTYTLKEGRDTIKLFKEAYNKKIANNLELIGNEEAVNELLIGAIEDLKIQNSNPIDESETK